MWSTNVIQSRRQSSRCLVRQRGTRARSNVREKAFQHTNPGNRFKSARVSSENSPSSPLSLSLSFENVRLKYSTVQLTLNIFHECGGGRAVAGEGKNERRKNQTSTRRTHAPVVEGRKKEETKS